VMAGQGSESARLACKPKGNSSTTSRHSQPARASSSLKLSTSHWFLLYQLHTP
jgi:hypothetical protein